MRFIRRTTTDEYTDDETISVVIGENTYPVNIEGLAVAPDEAIEVELDDGSVFVLLGYRRKT